MYGKYLFKKFLFTQIIILNEIMYWPFFKFRANGYKEVSVLAVNLGFLLEIKAFDLEHKWNNNITSMFILNTFPWKTG